MAQTCGAPITLSADQWRMVGIPCDPGANNTIADVFGPSMGIANYGVTWIAWKRLYDAPGSCAADPDPGDCYVKLTISDTVDAGDALWIYTTQQVSLDFSSIISSTPGPTFSFPAKLSTNGNVRYYMLANPYADTVNWADLVFNVVWFGFISIDYSTADAVGLGAVTENVYYWNGTNTYYTRNLGSIPPAATFVAKEASWLEAPGGSTFFADFSSPVTIRVPDPGAP